MWELKILDHRIIGIATSYAEEPPGSLVALRDSSNAIAISIVNGNAAQTLPAHVADQVELIISQPTKQLHHKANPPG